MISSYSLKFGKTPTARSEKYNAPPVTIFVGPNNSGKSQILKEILGYCSTGSKFNTNVLIEEIEFSALSEVDAISLLENLKVASTPGEIQNEGHIILRPGRNTPHRNRIQVEPSSIAATLQNPSGDINGFCTVILSQLTMMLDGSNRLSLVNPQTAGDLQVGPDTSLQVLFRNDQKRVEVRRIVNDAFNKFFVIDPTSLGTLRVKLASREPQEIHEERGLDDKAVKFHSEAQPVDNFSDGVKCFIGIIIELIAGDPKILLIDEPEAFLHPPLSAKLGNEIATAALRNNKKVFASTHSPNFLMGCISSGAPVNIIRLTYKDETPTARMLPSEELLVLMRKPLLRSTNILNSLFFESVIISEGDTDRAFYQEINERLTKFEPALAIKECFFANAQNKQTIKEVIKPLRNLGIPAAAVVDIDVFKEGGSVWNDLLRSAGVPDTMLNSLSTLRAAVRSAMDATGKDMKRDGGIYILPPKEQESARSLIDSLAKYGIFVVPVGEVEHWLSHLKVPGEGTNWLVRMFEKLGEDPSSSDYVKPTKGDVWEFISSIKTWLVSPRRLGIPD